MKIDGFFVKSTFFMNFKGIHIDIERAVMYNIWQSATE